MRRRGFRTRRLVPVTTLTDPKEYPAADNGRSWSTASTRAAGGPVWFRGGGDKTSVAPANQAELYAKAVPDLPDEQTNRVTWWSRDAAGNYHRFQGSPGMPVHWNGATNTDRGLVVPGYIRAYFEKGYFPGQKD